MLNNNNYKKYIFTSITTIAIILLLLLIAYYIQLATYFILYGIFITLIAFTLSFFIEYKKITSILLFAVFIECLGIILDEQEYKVYLILFTITYTFYLAQLIKHMQNRNYEAPSSMIKDAINTIFLR